MQASNCDVLDGRESCRTVRDALDRLGILDAPEAVVATIHAMEFPLPNGQVPGMVSIGTGAPGDSDRRFLRLPYSNTFRANLMDGTPIRGAIHELDSAMVEPGGTVNLSDGRRIRTVELQPGIIFQHYDFTWREHFVVHHALTLIGEEDRCYRLVNEQWLPGVKRLDYNAIQQVRVRNIKKLIAKVRKLICFQMSAEDIRNILRLSGMQFPRRARAKHRRTTR